MSWKEENKRHGQLTFFDVLFSKNKKKEKRRKKTKIKVKKKKGNIISTKKRKGFMRIKCYSEMKS